MGHRVVHHSCSYKKVFNGGEELTLWFLIVGRWFVLIVVYIHPGVLLVQIISFEILVEVIFTFKHSNDLVTMRDEFKAIREGSGMIWPVLDRFTSISDL
tara:strand:- start:570 stop:866 length:297 start_codon:yes stop_codon:yes gene_type:complete